MTTKYTPKLIFLSFITLISIFGCQSQKTEDDGKTYHNTFEEGTIPESEQFAILNEQEKRFDSVYNHLDLTIDSVKKADPSNEQNQFLAKKDFKENRSRIFMDILANGKTGPKDSISEKGFPTQCSCFISNDTLFVVMGVGFFGGFNLHVDLNKDKFQTRFFTYYTKTKQFKSAPSDTAFTNSVEVKGKYQHLVLDKKPTYQPGQQITGYLTLTTNNYYEKNYQEKLDSVMVSSRVYFTCKTRKKTMFD